MSVVEAALPPRRPRGSRVSVVGILGELFITVGVIALLFLGWQVWLGNLIDGNQQRGQAIELSHEWGKGDIPAPAPAEREDPGPPLVGEAPGNAVPFATMIIPRFGADYQRPIAEGVGFYDVLDLGVGHYPGTEMPGEVGNAAFAAHRTGDGSAFFDIDKLVVGDSIYVEMEAGWYRYVFRGLEYVHPNGVGVLAPVPQFPDVEPTDRILTLTSCNPIYTANERIIVYALYDTWYPRSAGVVPDEIAGLITASAAG